MHRSLPAPHHAKRNLWTPRYIRRWIIVGLLLTIGVSLIASAFTVAEAPSTLPATSPATTRTSASTQLVTDPRYTIIDNEKFIDLRGTPGYWRLGRTIDEVCWFISPDNHIEFMNTVTTVQPFQIGRRVGGPHYVSRDWNGTLGDPNSGDLTAWASSTLNRVRESGFKGLGAWCHPIFHGYDVPMTQDLNVTAHTIGHATRIYDPAWESVVEEAIRKQVEPLRENKNLVGYYTDNELDWGDTGAGPGRYFDNLSPGDPSRQKVIDTIRKLWPTIAEFNAAWKQDFTSWQDIDELPRLPHEPPDAYGKLFSAWLEQLASDYFRITTTLVRKYDPNHLVLGVRFRGHAPREVVRGSKGWTDAQSLNYYVADARLDAQMFPMMFAESGNQPIILTEYSFHSLDGRSGNRNTFGFAAQVIDQQARADGYRLFTKRLARTPYVIGADWFQWSDEPPSGRTVDGEDVNFGMVDVDDRPYEELADAVRETTPLLNDLHKGSASDIHADVFRQRFDDRPTAKIPYLAHVPTINGELSDWPAESRLKGIQRSQAVGLDRSPLPVPIVNVGWNERGLFFGIEVFDRDIEGAPAQGWWWTRDGIELFLSSRAPQPEQNFYTPSDAQFFFVPIAFPAADGSTGVVGRWHRNGDGLDAPRIPDPAVTEASRVFPDRYVVELFIPADQIKGFDPSGNTPMGFNFYARNFQNATEYFWSAPKEVQTQLRPGTWGEMILTHDVQASVASNTPAR
ncbi:MAG: hypothetical protein QM770_18875 [Tepidisphaeraceae bacterium]